jgi:hypothetical protein
MSHHYGTPLKVEVAGGELRIVIGVNVLAHAVSYADWANPYDEEKHDYIRTFAIADAEQFAKDVKRAMQDEREDGSSLLSDFLDKASSDAVDDGSEACYGDQSILHGKHAASETWAAPPERVSEGKGIPKDWIVYEARAISGPRTHLQDVEALIQFGIRVAQYVTRPAVEPREEPT